MKKSSIGILFLIGVTGVNAAPEIKGQPEELKQLLYPSKKTITINESVVEKAYTDTAMVTLVITTEDDKLASAIKTNEQTRKKIASQLIEAGLDAKKINSSKFSTSPQFGWFGKEPDSYEVVNRMVVNVNSEKLFQLTAKIADESRRVKFGKTLFEHSKKEEYENRVLEKASLKIQTKKVFYEKQLGLKLKVVGLNYFNVSRSPSGDFEENYEKIRVSGSRVKRRTENLDIIDAFQKQVSQTFDEVKYVASVSVEYEVLSD